MSTDKETRSFEQLKQHYEIEKELSDRLRSSSKDNRKSLYTSLYDELFTRVPHHPQLTSKFEPGMDADTLKKSIELLKHYSLSGSDFLEIGPGDCSLSLEASKIAKQVYAVDVSEIITSDLDIPDNFQLIISDGCSIPLPSESIDIAYSDQLMEHLHPEDAIEQLKNIFSVLKPGGKYLCITPNRVFGPHDISKYFDEVASGFHMKEYTITELSALFRIIGFSEVKRFVNVKGLVLELPLFPVKTFEKLLLSLSFSKRKKISKYLHFRLLLGGENIKLIATK